MDFLRSATVAAIMIAVALAGCAAAGEPIDEAGPTWSSGYAWAFVWQSEGEWVEEEDGERDNETWDRRGRETYEVMNTTLVFDGTPVYVVAGHHNDQDGDEYRNMEFVRQRDLATLPADWRVEVSCVNQDCDVQYSDFEVDAEDAPTFIDFPLHNGKSWSSVDQDWELEFVVRGTVTGRAVVDTPLGPVDAVRIDFVRVPVNLQEAIDEFKKEAAEEDGIRFDRFEVTLDYRWTVYYAPDYQMTVRTDAYAKEQVHISGTADGERFTEKENAKSEYHRVLEGGRLVAKPERPLRDVASFVAGESDILDPTGKGVGSGGYKITVVPEVDRINAAEAMPASYSIDVDGVPELPADHSVKWSLLDYADNEILTGQGLAWSPVVPRAGAYTVLAEALDGNGDTVSAAGAPLVADFIGSTMLSCGPVSVFSVGGCPQHPVPVHPGVRSLRVTATPQSPATSPLLNSFVLEDGEGDEADGQRMGDQWIVAVDDFTEFDLDDRSWQAVFDQRLGVADDVKLDMYVLYGPESGAPSAMASARAFMDGLLAPGGAPTGTQAPSAGLAMPIF